MNFDSKSQITVVIRTKNSSKTLSKCLKLLASQTVLLNEVIIVDSGSKDNTLKIARNNKCKIIFYPKVSFNYSKSLNLGIEQSKTPYILLFSSHAYLTEKRTLEWLKYFLDTHKLAAGVSVEPIHQDNNNKIQKIQNKKEILWNPINMYTFKGQALGNSCCLIRKKDWNIYPFNESIPRCEDIDWSLFFIKQVNRYVIRLVNIYVIYANPYYVIKKDILDYVLVSRLFHPSRRTLKFIIKLYLQSFRLLIFGWYPKTALITFRKASALIRDRIYPYNIQSGHLN